jgi:hypothetical protein
VIDPYEAVKDFLNRAEFWEYHAELWPAVLECIKTPDPAQTKYGDWLNGQARRFFRYVREKVGPDFLRYDPQDNGEVFIFVMDIADYTCLAQQTSRRTRERRASAGMSPSCWAVVFCSAPSIRLPVPNVAPLAPPAAWIHRRVHRRDHHKRASCALSHIQHSRSLASQQSKWAVVFCSAPSSRLPVPDAAPLPPATAWIHRRVHHRDHHTGARATSPVALRRPQRPNSGKRRCWLVGADVEAARRRICGGGRDGGSGVG